MQIDWQNALVLIAVLTAGGYVLRSVWQAFSKRRQAGCGGCGTCTASKTAAPTLVEIAPLNPKER